MTPEKNKEMTPETHIPIKISPRDGRIRISSDNGGTVFVKCKPDDEGDLTLTITTKGQENVCEHAAGESVRNYNVSRREHYE